MHDKIEIERIELFQAKTRLKQPFIISLGAFDHAENIIVRIFTDQGIIGYGECSPFKSINGESIDTCYIVGQYIARALIGKNTADIESCVALMDKVIYGNNSIKSAFDMALYDIISKSKGIPLYEMLGGKNKTLFTDYTVSIGDADKMAEDAFKVKADGYPAIKIKLGDTPEKDLHRIKTIRNKTGMEIPFRLDANQGWDVKSAVPLLNELYHYNIQFCEEPIPRWDYMNLPEINSKSLVPVMADESCFDDHDAERLIAINACRLFNIKLGKSAGFHRALRITEKAASANIQLQVGGFLESSLGFTAAAHLALSGSPVMYCDFDTPLMFKDDYVHGGIVYGSNGQVQIPSDPGLGVTVDERFLKKCYHTVIS